MQTGAVIAAAGLSSRMGDFKPMLKIGSASMAQRIIIHFHRVGVFPIVVVTGFRSEALEQHLSRLGVLFVRNERYETSDMFASAKIGLSVLMDKCDRSFFTPVDVPLFTRGTLTKLMDVTAPVVKPVCGRKTGHPILLSCKLLPQVLAYKGDGGLRGALASCGGNTVLVDVDDQGILLDADTPDNFRQLTKLYTQMNLHPEADVVCSN
ncbi:MAG: nucleotidyltransferase family protein [Clostridia bacterium]|nr:nucleotidyltransferase family protein [Clostridia bacterium]